MLVKLLGSNLLVTDKGCVPLEKKKLEKKKKNGVEVNC